MQAQPAVATLNYAADRNGRGNRNRSGDSHSGRGGSLE
jgi:hypothetical protein